MIYEYHCNECGESFDVLAPASAWKDKRACPECDSWNTGRTLSVPNGITKPGNGYERWSLALGCPRRQIAEMKSAMERNGATNVEFHPQTGACRVRGKKHERELLKSRGMVRLD